MDKNIKEEVKTTPTPVVPKEDKVEVIWKKAGNNEPLTPEEYEIYTQEVARRRNLQSE